MKTITTLAAIAALTTLAACSKEEAPAEVVATEAAPAATEAATEAAPAATEAAVEAAPKAEPGTQPK